MPRRIVYFGPAAAGKTTNLFVLSRAAPETANLRAIPLEADRVLSLSLALPSKRGETMEYELVTIAGSVFYETAWTDLFRGADGFVFVADGRKDAADDNLYSLRRFDAHLKSVGLNRTNSAVVFQANKLDLAGTLTPAAMEKQLGEHVVPAMATQGRGVVETLRAALERFAPAESARIDWAVITGQPIPDAE